MTPEAWLDSLFALPTLVLPRVSPDRAWVAWSWMNLTPGMDVWVAPTDGSQPPIRLSQTPEQTICRSFTPDSRSVIVSEDHDGNERHRLFRVDLAAPGVMVPLTEDDPHYFLSGGELHPDGRTLVYGANWDEARRTEIDPTWIYRHDVVTGERRVLARPVRPAHVQVYLAADGRHVLYCRSDRHPAGIQWWVVGIDGTGDREVLHFGDDVKCHARFCPDGRTLIYVLEKATHAAVGLYDLETGSHRTLLDDPSRFVEWAFVPRRSAHAVIGEVRQARARTSLLHLETGAEIEVPPPPGETLSLLAPVAEDRWLAMVTGSRQPGDVITVAVPGSAEPPRSIARPWERTPLTPGELASSEEVSWTSTDGEAIQGWLYRARGAVKGTIVDIHGGPTSCQEDDLSAPVQFFASQGFHVLCPNYRGSTGFGLRFRELIKADGWGGREQDDIRTGIEELIRRGIASPGRVGVTGTSYGGYSSWCLVTRCPPEIVAAAAPVCGMTDLVVDYETTRPDLRCYSEEMMGGSPQAVPERYRERSPGNFVDSIRGRLLIVQGAQDPNVTPENVRTVRERLDAAGIPYEVLIYDDEGHGISRPENRKDLCLRLARFFESAFRSG